MFRAGLETKDDYLCPCGIKQIVWQLRRGVFTARYGLNVYVKPRGILVRRMLSEK